MEEFRFCSATPLVPQNRMSEVYSSYDEVRLLVLRHPRPKYKQDLGMVDVLTCQNFPGRRHRGEGSGEVEMSRRCTSFRPLLLRPLRLHSICASPPLRQKRLHDT